MNMSILKAENISLTFPDQSISVLKNINLDVPESTLTVVLGESGCGKTTLLNILAGFQQLSAGQVKIDEEVLTGPDARRAVVFQEHALLPWLNVSENVAFSLKLKGLKSAEIQTQVAFILDTVGLSHVANSNIWELSGGMKQRVGIARALISHAAFILLDEPFAGVDPIAVEDIQKIVRSLVDKNIGILITDHNVQQTLAITHKTYIMFEGKILKEGIPEDLANDPEVRQAYLGENFRFEKF